MLLEAKNLAVRYRNGALGIVDVSLDIPERKVVALLGPNGAGKTTTVRALSGFMRTEGAKIIMGSLTFEGKNVTGWEPHQLVRLGIATVPERNKVFRNLSVREHLVSAGLDKSRAKRDDGIELGLSLFPVLNEKMRLSAGRLSGGQQQMLAIVRALASCPRLLVVDEMTLGLHPSLQPVLFQAIRKIADSGTSALIVDESTSYALSTSDYCYQLSSGRITRDGVPSDFVGTELEASGFLEEAIDE